MSDVPNILIVDDDHLVLEYLKTALEEHGYDVTATASGRQALDFLHSSLPDLLILDLNMPEPDGFDLLRIERSKYPYLRILVISGYLHGALLEAAKIFGAVATLQKPISSDMLIKTVREILGGN